MTDDLTLWTNNRAIWNKGQEATCAAFLYLLREMPFIIRSINTDNGSEFINYHLQRMLREKHKKCRLTRSRPYKKNDNARAEERNRHKVRELIGYERIGMEECVYLLNQVYRYHNLLTNFFVAGTRLLSKQKNPVTGKTQKRYDRARTPYERVLEHMKEGRRKQKLMALRESLASAAFPQLLPEPLVLSHGIKHLLALTERLDVLPGIGPVPDPYAAEDKGVLHAQARLQTV